MAREKSEAEGNVLLAALTVAGLALFLTLVVLPALKFGFIPAAAYFGTLAGATLGFVALMAGHFYNSHLNRKRDRELRVIRADACAVAILYELSINVGTFRTVIEYLSMNGHKTHIHVAQYADQFSSEIFRENVVDFCAGIIEAGGTTDIRPISSFYSNVALSAGIMKKAAEVSGPKPIEADELRQMIEKFSEALVPGEMAIAEVRRLRALLAKPH